MALTARDAYFKGYGLYQEKEWAAAAKVWKNLLQDTNISLSTKMKVRTCVSIAMAYNKLEQKHTAIKVLKFANRIDPTDNAVYKARDKVLGRTYGSYAYSTTRPSSDHTNNFKSSTQKTSIKRRNNRNKVRNSRNRKGKKQHTKNQQRNNVDTLGDAMESVQTGIMMENGSPGQGKPYFKEALPVLEKALSEGKSPAQVHSAIGTCLLYGNKDIEKAKSHFQKSLEINPGDDKSALELAKIYKRDGKIKDELTVLDKYMKAGGESPKMDALIASAYGRRNQSGDDKTALKYAQKAIDYDPSYGTSIVEEVTDDKVRKKIGIMIAKAEAANLADSIPSNLKDKVKNIAKSGTDSQKKDLISSLTGNKELMDKLKKKFGNRIPSKYKKMLDSGEIPDKFKNIADKYKGRASKYLK